MKSSCYKLTSIRYCLMDTHVSEKASYLYIRFFFSQLYVLIIYRFYFILHDYMIQSPTDIFCLISSIFSTWAIVG